MSRSIPMANLGEEGCVHPDSRCGLNEVTDNRTQPLSTNYGDMMFSVIQIPEQRDAVEYHTKKIERTDMYDMLQKKCLFDSLGCQFHFSVFFYQFISHLLLPLMFFLPNLAAQGIRCTSKHILSTILNPIIFYAMIIAFLFCTPNDKDLLGYSIIIPLLFFIVHRTTVALKYATLSPTEYSRFMSCKDVDLLDCYINQMQLLCGWACLDSMVLYFELSAASSRVGVKINQLFVRISSNSSDPAAVSQFRYWNAFVRGHERIDIDAKPAREFVRLPNGDYGISVFDVCLAIIRRSNNIDATMYYVEVAVNILTLMLVLLMILPALIHANEVENSVAVALYFCAAAKIFWTYGRLFFGFLYVALIDVGRFCSMTKTLHCMIRLTDIMMHNSVTIAQEKITSCHDGMSRDRVDTILAVCKPPGKFSDTKLCFYDTERADDYTTYDAIYQPTEQSIKFLDDQKQELINKEKHTSKFGEKLAEHLSFAMVPKVNLLYPENSTAWIYARLTIQNFGERFRNRTDIYIAFTMILVVVMMLITLLVIIASPNRKAAYVSSLFLQAIVIVSLFIFKIALLTVIGSSVNDELVSQCRTLAAHAVRIKSKLFRFRQAGRENQYHHSKDELEQALESVTQINEVADINNQLKPFKVFGMTAQNGLTMSVLTGAASFYSIIFSMYSASSSNSLFSTIISALRR